MVLAKDVIETKKNNLVTKSNMLIEANYRLGVVEQKIILYLASNIHPNDSDFKTYTLPIKEFNKLLGLKGTPKYTELRQITKELMQKVFEVRINKKVIQVAWLSYVAYNESQGTIDIRFDPFLRPYLLELKKEFTSYKLENVVKLKSSYSIRLYELLKQYEKLHERTFLLIDLRKMLGAEDIYPAYGNFKQRVLVPAQKELKKSTDISFEIEEIKVGRRVDRIKFLISSTKHKKTNEQLNLFDGNLEDFKLPNTFRPQVKKLALKMGFQVSDEVIDSWEKHGQENVISLIEKLQGRTDIMNPIGYITTVLNANIAGAEQVAASSEEQKILTHLISGFRKSKESLPYWFIKDNAIKEMMKHFEMNEKEAVSYFDKIKAELYEALEVTEPKSDLSEEEIAEKKKSMEELLKKYKK